jgi:Ca-activated chloride channel homolog
MTMTANAPTTTSAHAGGRLVAHDGRELPLRAVHLQTRAAGGIARVVLTQTFKNPFPEPIEVRYLVPLPSEGAVSGFSFVLGDTRVEGVVTGKQEARQRFQRAISQGKTAALLEQDRTSLFTQRVGNVPPGSEIVCELVIDQPLRWLEEGCWEWRFPTVVAPRYQGAPGRVEDADKLQVPVSQSSVTGGEGLGVRASLALTIGDGLTGPVNSPSHEMQAKAERLSETTEVRLEGAGARLDRDVVVRWPIALPSVSASVIPARPAAEVHGGDTFALLTVAPPTGGGEAVARDLTFLIDTSGSMGGRPLDQAQQVVAAMLETLGPNDRIELIEFGSRPKRFKKKPIPATEKNRAAALKWVRNLRSSGCTEMHRAVIEALAPLREESQRQVILITDGYIGFEQEIVSTLLRELPDGARLHTIGVGSSVNRTLTQGAARAGRGTELLIGLDEDPQTLIPRFVAKTTAPLVTDIVVSGPGVIEIAPRQLPDLYAESPALFAARLRPEGGTVVLSGRTAKGRFEQRFEVPALELGEGHEGVVALFGREKVEDLEMTLSAGGGVAEINSAIEATGIDFQIATRLTSWVAVSKKATVATREQPTTVDQPHELPHGTSAEGLGLRKPRRQSLSGKQKDGRAAAKVKRKRPAPAKPAPADGYLTTEEAKELYERNEISLEDAMERVEDPEELKMPLRGVGSGSRATDLDFNFGDVDERQKQEEAPEPASAVEVPSFAEDLSLVETESDAALVEFGSDEGMETELYELMDEGGEREGTIILTDSDQELGIAYADEDDEPAFGAGAVMDVISALGGAAPSAAPAPADSWAEDAKPIQQQDAESIIRRVTTKRVLPAEQQVSGARARKASQPIKLWPVLIVLLLILGALVYLFGFSGLWGEAPAGQQDQHKSAPASPGVGGK